MANKGYIYIDSSGTKKSTLASVGGTPSTDAGKLVLFGTGGDLNANELNTDDGFGNTGVYAPTQFVLGVTGLFSKAVRLGDTPGGTYKLPSSGTSDGLIFGGVSVRFDGTVNNNLACTYSRTGTTVTVTSVNHLHLAGHIVQLDFAPGGAVDGSYTITSVPDGDTYTVTTAASGTIAAGTAVTELRIAISLSHGVHSVADITAGTYHVNFSEAFPSATYYFCGASGSAGSSRQTLFTVAQTAQGMRVTTATIGGTPVVTDADWVSASFWR